MLVVALNLLSGCISMDKLLGLTFDKVVRNDDAIVFYQGDVKRFSLHHEQDCCESVYVEDVAGDLDDLVGTPILLAEEAYENDPDAGESGTWSFYKIATVKGHVTIRFYGSSNGYYGETAGLYRYNSNGARIW